MGGTFDKVSEGDLGVSTPLAVGTVRVSFSGTCTLLGPEGPGTFGWLYLWAFLGCRLCWLRGGYRPYFENYTVDASILNDRTHVISSL